MRGGSDFFFVKHAPSRKASGAFNQKITELITGDDKCLNHLECEDANETFQRVAHHLMAKNIQKVLSNTGLVTIQKVLTLWR